MSDRRTQSYAAVPRFVIDECAVGMVIAEPGRVRQLPMHHIVTDPDFEPELPPSPTFWPRDEPKEPGR
jgi:hypothetical protein